MLPCADVGPLAAGLARELVAGCFLLEMVMVASIDRMRSALGSEGHAWLIRLADEQRENDRLMANEYLDFLDFLREELGDDEVRRLLDLFDSRQGLPPVAGAGRRGAGGVDGGGE